MAIETLRAEQDSRVSREETSRYFYPNKMGRIILLAMEEEMGRNGVNAILNLARLQHRIDSYPPNNFAREFAFDEVGQIFQAVDEMYGSRAGRGLARRVGQTCFKMGVGDFGPILSLSDLVFRILPMRMKLLIGFEVLAQTLNRFTDQVVRVDEDDRYYRWIFERCGICWGRRSDSPCCHLAVGILEEEVYWISGGGRFYIEEVSCIAAGDDRCTILIGKQPLE